MTVKLVFKQYQNVQIDMQERTTQYLFNLFKQELKSHLENHLHQKYNDYNFLLH